MTLDEQISFCEEKSKNIKLKAKPQTFVDIKNSLEKLKNPLIPCSERLPKYGEVVMCSCTNSGITISCITHKGVEPSKSVRFGQHSVIAWQPLPKPYNPKGE